MAMKKMKYSFYVIELFTGYFVGNASNTGANMTDISPMEAKKMTKGEAELWKEHFIGRGLRAEIKKVAVEYEVKDVL